MKKKLMVIVSFIFVLITVISCSGLIDDSTNNTQNNIVNNVTNEITNKVVNYEEITVHVVCRSALHRSFHSCPGGRKRFSEYSGG